MATVAVVFPLFNQKTLPKVVEAAGKLVVKKPDVENELLKLVALYAT